MEPRPSRERSSNSWQPPVLSSTKRESAKIEQDARELLLEAGGFPADAIDQVALAARLAERIEHHSPRLGFELARMPYEKDGEACVIYGLPAQEELAAIIQLALSTLLGDPFNYAEQNKGAMAMRLEPQPGSAANTNTTTGDFALHSDDAAMPEELRAIWLSLYGVRNPRGTLTGYAPIRVILDDLDSVSTDIQATLSGERFSVRMPLSFGLGDNQWSPPCSILGRDDNDRVTIAWPSYATRVVDNRDTEATEALVLLKRAAELAVAYVALSPGTMLVFSNLHGVHKRSAITGNGDRLIFRNYIRPNLTALRGAAGHDGHIFALRDILGSGAAR